ncbi:basic endochitinase c [Quercus suber]|uniref:chitinase n=1 Tax=Quercus suber TaxID=58331 RepID=A0AAW0J031_QUESU
MTHKIYLVLGSSPKFHIESLVTVDLFKILSNYNYALAGKAVRENLINNPDSVATDAMISFKTAIWLWMTPQGNKPSSQNVIIGKWTPTPANRSVGRVPSYGVITNIINGGLERGRGHDERVASRISFYKKYCDIMGLSYENNLDCYNQRPFD